MYKLVYLLLLNLYAASNMSQEQAAINFVLQIQNFIIMETDVAASSPATEVVAKGDFLRFSVNDSLTLEAAFLRVPLRHYCQTCLAVPIKPQLNGIKLVC
mgnify:FL=1